MTLVEVKERLKEHFKMKDLESAEFVLGVESTRILDGGSFLVQYNYASKVVTNFGMGDVKVALTPLEPKSKLGEAGEEARLWSHLEMEDVPYRSLVATLMYLALGTRPSLSMVV